MADDIVIDKELFHERLGNFVQKWKTDKRSGDAIFQGVGSIATVVGKQSDPSSYLKPAAFQVSRRKPSSAFRVELTALAQLWLLGYEFPATLFIITPELFQIVTTKKKGM